MLLAGVHPKVASERHRHASIEITLARHRHVLETVQVDAAADVGRSSPAARREGAGTSASRTTARHPHERPCDHVVVITHPVSVRFREARVAERLKAEAGARATSTSALAEELIDEGLRVRRHPLVCFRDGPAGRRACLVGASDVWEVIGGVVGGDVPPDERVGRAIVTENVADLDRIVRAWAAAGEHHAGVVLASPRRFHRGSAAYAANLVLRTPRRGPFAGPCDASVVCELLAELRVDHGPGLVGEAFRYVSQELVEAKALEVIFLGSRRRRGRYPVGVRSTRPTDSRRRSGMGTRCTPPGASLPGASSSSMA